MDSKESRKRLDRVFVYGKQFRLEKDRLTLLERSATSMSGSVKVGWKTLGVISYKSAICSVKANALLFEILSGDRKQFSVAVPLAGSHFKVEGNSTIQFHTDDALPYLWVRCPDNVTMNGWVRELDLVSRSEVSFNDFEIIRAVGKGGMGKVFLGKHRRTGERLAIKVIDKTNVFGKEGHLQHMVDERLLLEMGAGQPFVLKLKYAFQTESNFFLATEFCEGGDLYHLLKRRRKTLSESATKFIASEVILAVESMHAQGCVYRDLKPDNVLLDAEGHVRLADFGLAKLLKKSTSSNKYQRTNSFCGTAQYTPPEMIQKRFYDQSIDSWCLGVFLYEIVEGSTPFYSREREVMYKRIEKDSVEFSKRFSDDLKDLISHLLEKSPKRRYTLDQVKKHKFFKGVDWDKVQRKEFWSKTVYTSKERKEVSLEELRLINVEKYKNLTVQEEEDVKSPRAFRLGPKKLSSGTVPGFIYVADDSDDERRSPHASSSSGSGNEEDSGFKSRESSHAAKNHSSVSSLSFRRPSESIGLSSEDPSSNAVNESLVSVESGNERPNSPSRSSSSRAKNDQKTKVQGALPTSTLRTNAIFTRSRQVEK
uniref:Protein kinase domain-containing protein n=1 Tax=Rhodosorus marinus TaxID=101924 RepID=A0A7S2ZJM4_9RHOD|mmetsp:Transcript_21757/g.88626  ORF Transcript_21757/g.88626 Transcript_21757/m.88626 type:complete len:595 (+) Transcript_21757:182-1966(+)|eukprot:CAMPEP_0113966684 /NCGR_PEP_ID=MMETSP0011_2-20120614/8459_1 /TAXON_ID=101924 /ORGANISM="Rhodosorus marinus" /LENGTH=594 /DNA_ID=CAMNT_0000979379 /DNA_START=139 /DNA_END=1923 /DNA_ORIENTATION=+ /assembly_acc=CAM_ASM_000156